MADQQRAKISDPTLGRAAAATVSDLDALNDACATQLRRTGLHTVARALARGVSMDEVDLSHVNHLTDLQAEAAASFLHVNALWTMWEHRRVVYAVHPQLSDQLSTVNWDRVPASVIDRMPRSLPLTVFTEPVTVAGPNNNDIVVVGFLLSGVDDNNHRYCTLHDPGRTSLEWTLFFDSADEVAVASLKIPNTASLSVDSVIDRTTTSVRAVDLVDHDRVLYEADLRETLAPALRLAVATTVYLCSREPDTVTSTRRIRRQGLDATTSTRRRDKSATVIETGWRLGPSPNGPRRRNNDSTPPRQGPAVPTGRTVRPHTREAHPHIYRVGPGRRDYVVHLLPEIDVNAHLRDPEHPVTTVYPLRDGPGQGPQPDADMHALAAATTAHTGPLTRTAADTAAAPADEQPALDLDFGHSADAGPAA